jgi:hypothetical protein
VLPKRATVRRRSGGGRSCEGAAAAAAQGPCTPCQVKSQLSQVYTGSRKVPTSRRRARKRANVLPVGNQISPASLTRSTTACARSGSTAPLSHGSASAPCPSWATSRWHRKTRSFGHSPTSATPTCSTGVHIALRRERGPAQPPAQPPSCPRGCLPCLAPGHLRWQGEQARCCALEVSGGACAAREVDQ